MRLQTAEIFKNKWFVEEYEEGKREGCGGWLIYTLVTPGVFQGSVTDSGFAYVATCFSPVVASWIVKVHNILRFFMGWG